MRISLFVFIDAFGWEILKQHRFLEDSLPYRQPLGTMFGYSSTCDPTIITGALPRDHGHFSFFVYDPKKSPFKWLKLLKVLPGGLTDRGRVRHIISKLVQKFYRYTGYFELYGVPFDLLPQFDYTEKSDIYFPGGINGGQSTIFDLMRKEGKKFCLSDWRKSEAENLSHLEAEIQKGEINFGYLYMAAMDAVLHADGTQSERVTQKIAWYELQLRRVYELAKKQYDDVRITVFSDHGMTDIRQTCDIIKLIESTGLKFGDDYAAMYDSTMARFWFLKPSSQLVIENALSTVNQGRVLTQEELHEWGVDFPDERYGDLIFVMNPHVLLCPSFMGKAPLKGMHGFEPTHVDSVAMLCSNHEPEIKPRRLENMYVLMKSHIQWAWDEIPSQVD